MIKNNDIDSYGSITFDIELNNTKSYNIDLNELHRLKHKELILNVNVKH